MTLPEEAYTLLAGIVTDVVLSDISMGFAVITAIVILFSSIVMVAGHSLVDLLARFTRIDGDTARVWGVDDRWCDHTARVDVLDDGCFYYRRRAQLRAQNRNRNRNRNRPC